jgi:hypothetical protein
MVSFQTKNPNLGKFWMALHWKMLVYFMAIWNILQTFGIFYGHMVHFRVIWYIFPRFGMLCREKSGSPALNWYLCDAKSFLWPFSTILHAELALDTRDQNFKAKFKIGVSLYIFLGQWPFLFFQQINNAH